MTPQRPYPQPLTSSFLPSLRTVPSLTVHCTVNTICFLLHLQLNSIHIVLKEDFPSLFPPCFLSVFLFLLQRVVVPRLTCTAASCVPLWIDLCTQSTVTTMRKSAVSLCQLVSPGAGVGISMQTIRSTHRLPAKLSRVPSHWHQLIGDAVLPQLTAEQRRRLPMWLKTFGYFVLGGGIVTMWVAGREAFNYSPTVDTVRVSSGLKNGQLHMVEVNGRKVYYKISGTTGPLIVVNAGTSEWRSHACLPSVPSYMTSSSQSPWRNISKTSCRHKPVLSPLIALMSMIGGTAAEENPWKPPGKNCSLC